MLLDFNARGRLIRPMSLSIRFLFVRLRFRYCFFSPIPHDMNLASRFRVRRKLRPLWTFTTDERHARHTAKQLYLKRHSCFARFQYNHNKFLLTSRDDRPARFAIPPRTNVIIPKHARSCKCFLKVSACALSPFPAAHPVISGAVV